MNYIAEGLALPPIEKRKTAEYLEEATGCLNEAEKRNNSPNQLEEVTIRKGKKKNLTLLIFLGSRFRSIDVGKEHY